MIALLSVRFVGEVEESQGLISVKPPFKKQINKTKPNKNPKHKTNETKKAS